MSPAPPTLHMMRGKIAAGKSTLTARPGNADETVVAAKDAWLDHLYSDRMSSVADYVRCSAKLRQVWGPHIAALLNAGISVVLGFPANTIETRTWMRDIPEQTTAAHALHVLDVPDAVCLARPQRPQRTGRSPVCGDRRTVSPDSKTLCCAVAGRGFQYRGAHGRVHSMTTSCPARRRVIRGFRGYSNSVEIWHSNSLLWQKSLPENSQVAK